MLRSSFATPEDSEVPPVCAYCEACEVAEEGDFCSDECEERSKQEDADDAAFERMRDAEMER